MKEDLKTNHIATIDGQKVKARKGLTILDAARKEGIYIPTLCHLDKLEPFGGCRLCVVEVDQMKGFPTACTTPIEPGMKIRTRTPQLQKLRSEILEFTLSEHPFTCLVCKDKRECTDFMHSTRKVNTITGCNFCTSNGDCELQDLVDYLDLQDVKFPITYRGIPPVKDNPFYDLDYNLCVLCGRCVRICNEERNSHVLAFVERGNSTLVGTAFEESQLEAGCEYCGACVDVCPTGSISEKMGKWRGVPDRSVTTTCALCPVGCGMNVNTRNGALVQIGPRPGQRIDPPQLCLRGKFLPAQLSDHPSRITTPLLKKGEKWVEISWNEAFEEIAGKIEPHRGKHFGLIASGQDTLEDNYALQKFTRKVMRSNNVDLHSSYPSRELPEELHRFYALHPPAGEGDLKKADTLLVIGLDASVSHPLLENQIRKAYNAGKQVIYANAFPTRTSTFITHEIRVIPGEEERLLEDLLTILVENKASGNASPEIHQAGSLLRGSKRLVILAGDPLLRNPGAGQILQTLFALHTEKNRNSHCHLLFPGSGGNLYAGTLAGAHPDYLPGFEAVSVARNRQKWGKSWETSLSDTAGWSCNEMIHNISGDGIRALMVMGDLPVHPNLDKLEFLVQCNMFRTGLSDHADLFLPVADFLENEGHLLSMDGKIKKVNRAVTPAGKVKSISGILAGLATTMKETGFRSNPSAHYREIRSLIHSPEKTATGKKTGTLEAGIRKVKKDGTYPVRLVYNPDHYTYRGNRLSEQVPDLRSISREGVISLPPSLVKQLKIQEGDRVRIVTPHGASDAVCSPMPGLTDNTACIYPSGDTMIKLQGGVSPASATMDARIEKA